MQHVSEAIGIEELLGVTRAARVAGPDAEITASADEHSPFRPQQNRHQQENNDYPCGRQELALVHAFRIQT